MNKFLMIGAATLVLIITVLILSTCSNPFSAGLGEKVDLEDPVLEITSHVNGDAVGGTTVLSGTVEDDGIIKSVKINLDTEGNEIGSATITDSTWSLSYDTSTLPDGDHQFFVFATDNTDRTVSRKVFLTVDNNPPSVIVTSPSSYGTAIDDPEFNKSITIKGEAADTTRVKEVRLYVYKESDGSSLLSDSIFPGFNTNNIATGTSSWYFILDASSILNLTNYYINVIAEDYSGNKNTYFYHFKDLLDLAVDKGNIPNIEEINANDYQAVLIPVGPTGLIDPDLTTIEKTIGIGSRMVIKIDPASDQPQFTIINPAEGSILPSENIFSSPQRLSGFVEDDDLAGIDENTLTLTIYEWGTSNVIGTPAVYGVDPNLTLSGNTWTYESSLVDGEYGVQLTVIDMGGNTGTSSEVPFKVSSFAPVVSLNNPQQGIYIGKGSTTTVQVTVMGASGDEVFIDLNDNGTYEDPGEKMNILGGGVYDFDIIEPTNLTGLVNGDNIFQIRAGVNPNFGTTTLQYTGDIDDPTVAITYPPDSANVNGIVNISGTTLDNYLIENVYVWISTESDWTLLPTDYVVNPGWIEPTGTYNWTLSNLDTNTLTDNTSYTIFVKSFDASGNESDLSLAESSLSFTVNQESDRPVISLSNMVEGGSSNGLAQDASIIGLIEDDDLVDVSSLEVRVDIYNDGLFPGVDLTGSNGTLDANESEQWIPIIPGATSGDDVRILSWAHNLLNVPQGVHSMQIRVHDTISDGVTFDEGTNPNYAELQITEFIIDYGPPDLVITTPVSGAIFNIDFTIEGTATDPNNVTDVEISFDAGTTYQSLYTDPVGLGLVNWTHTFTVDPAGADDRDYTYLIQATDSSGGKTTLNRQIVVDATDPTVIIELPGAGSIVNGDTVTIRGTANDNTQVSKVYLAQNTSLPAVPAGNDPAADIAYTELGSTYTWSYNLDSTTVHNTDSDQSYFISIVAVDGAGNLSIKEDINFTINQGSDRPVITFNDIDKAETVAANNVLVGATTLTGIIEDDDLIDPLLFGGNSIEISLDGAAWIPVSIPPAASGKFVVWRHDISALTEGAHLVKVRARDNQSDSSIGISSVDALYSTNFNWNIEDSTDQNGIPFILNLGPPSITMDTPPNYSFHNTDVIISGTAVDANGVDTVKISFDNGATWSADIFTADPNWTYTLPVIDGDGTKTYIIQATDIPGSTGVENGQFTIDATPPTSTINLPADGATVNGQLTISGTAGDNISLSSAYYSITSTPVFPGDYTLLAGSYSWSDSIDTTALSNSTFTLSIMAEDSAGNPSVVNTADFTVDQTSDRPVINFNSIVEAGTFEQNLLPSSKQIAGTITDDDSVDVSTIQYQLYEEDGTSLIAEDGSPLAAGTWTSISGAPGSDTTLATWTHTFGGTMVDGKYHIRLRTADTYDAGAFTGGGFGWDTSALVEFAVDTANPETTILQAKGGYTNQDFTVSGTATDDGGIKRVEIQFNAEPVIELYVDADLLAPYNTSQGWSTSYTIDTATHGDDGVLNYVVTITDAYDKIKTYDRYVNVDTQVPVINSLTLVNNDAGTPAIVNGSVLVQGAPIDYEALVNAIYIRTATAQPAEPGADPVAEGWTLLPSTTNIYHRFDSTALTDLTAYTTYIVLDDLAGNRTLVTDYTLPFTITQSGNTPVITMNTADASLLTSGDSITGSITDDDGVDVSTIEISIDGGAFIPVTSTSTSDSTNVVFSHSLGALGEQIAAYSIEIKAFDIGEDFVDNAQDIAPVSSTSTAINIFVDDSDPTAGITQIDNGNTTAPTLQGLYINDQFTITGTSTDGVQVADVRAKLDIAGDLFTTVPVTDTGTDFDTWSWTRSGLPVIGADSVIMNLEVEDIHGKVTPYSFTLLVDETVPNISITTAAVNPSTASGAYNGTQTFMGASSDNIQIDTVYYMFDNAGNPSTTDPVTDSWIPATGTYSWNFSLDTVNDATYGNNTAVDSTVYLGVVSLDSAGNISAVQNINFTINQGSDQPVLSVTQPTDGGLIESNKKVIGSLSDDDGLFSLQIRIDRDNSGVFGDIANETYVDISQPATVSGVNINFEHDLSALADGPYKIQLQAVDTVNANAYNTTTSSVISFDIDTLAPVLTLNQITVQNRYGGADTVIAAGFNGSYINNDSTLDFSASDSSGVASVEVSTDGGTTWTSDTTAPYSYLLNVAGLSEGTNNITYRATDNRGKITSKILTLIVDTVEPGITFSNPTGVTTAVGNDAPNVNGDVTIRGSVSDSSSISSVTITGGIAADVIIENTGNTISWIGALSDSDVSVTSDNSGTYANLTYSYDTDDDGSGGGIAWDGIQNGSENLNATNIWRFPVESTSEDFAGNITTVTGFIDIDPDSDNPIISIVSPANDASVSGTFLLNGTILDDDGTDYVELQFDFNDDTLFDDTGDSAGSVDLLLSNDLTAYGLPDSEINESTPIPLPAPNGSWSIALNASDFTLAKLAIAGYTGNGFLSLRVVPFDINGLQGAEQIVRIYLDTTSPVIEGLDTDGTTEIADPTPAGSTLQKGTITLRARFEDDKELLESSMLISLDGGATFSAINSAYITDQGTTNPYKYYIEIPIDTTSIDDPISTLVGGNGLLSIQLSITDQTNKQNSESITYSVDNNLPTIHWNEDGSGVLQDLPFIPGIPPIYTFKGNSGTSDADDAYKVLGAAIDSGTISGISKVNVYFVKAGSFYSPVDGASTAVVNSDIADDTGTPVSIPFTENISYVITIDNRIEQGIFDQTADIGDFDGFQESLKVKSGYDEWYSFYDTTQLPDGPLEIYAVAYDEAGNMSYTVADAQIANNPPTIPTVVVGGTPMNDITDKSKVSGSVQFTINTADAENIDVSTISMEVITRYAVLSGGLGTEDTGYTPPAAYLYANFDTKPGGDTSPAQFIETIDTTDDNGTPADPDDDPYKSGFYYEFLVQVNDSDGNIVERTFYIWVNNSDSSAPSITVDDFSQSGVSDGNGHVEEETNSPNDRIIDGAATDDPDGLKDADLSGIVTVSGTAYDDSSVSSITVEYSLNNGTNWTDAGSITSTLTADGQIIQSGGNLLDGFDYTWTYNWDTSIIEDAQATPVIKVAEEDVLIRAYATDGTNETAATAIARDEKIVDVVPYITDITTGFEIGLKAFIKRSALGKYTVSQGVGSSVTIIGYNLPGTTNGTVDLAGASITGSSPVGTTKLDISLSGLTTSGNLTVTTNGVESLNNTNNNILSQNQEPAQFYPDRNDDRYVALWELINTGYSGDDATMRPIINTSNVQTGFDWMYTTTSDTLNISGVKMTSSFSLSGGDFAYNSSGTRLWTFLHDIKWWSEVANIANTAFYGSIQWSMQNGYDYDDEVALIASGIYPQAYNWNMDSGRLGLGNMVYPDGTNGQIDRYENIKFIASGTNTNTANYISYYDNNSANKGIVFIPFETGTGVTGYDLGTGWNSTIERTMLTPVKAFSPTGNEDGKDSGIGNPILAGTTTMARNDIVSGSDSSNDFALEVVSGTAYLVWYDPDTGGAGGLLGAGLKFMYDTSPIGSPSIWSTPVTIQSNGANTAYSHIALKVDLSGGVHIAYQDNNSGFLNYTYAASAAAVGTTMNTVVVDALYSSGQYNSMKIMDFDSGTGGTDIDYRPVITTFSSAYTGSNVALRLVYPLSSPAVVGEGANQITGDFSGEWESIAIPASTAPKSVLTFTEFNSDDIDSSTANPIIGYNGSYMEQARYLDLP